MFYTSTRAQETAGEEVTKGRGQGAQLGLTRVCRPTHTRPAPLMLLCWLSDRELPQCRRSHPERTSVPASGRRLQMFTGHLKQANAGTRTATSLLVCAEKSGLTKYPTLPGTSVLRGLWSQLSQMDRTGPGSEGGMEILLWKDFSWGTWPFDSLESHLRRGRPSARTPAKLASCLGRAPLS